MTTLVLHTKETIGALYAWCFCDSSGAQQIATAHDGNLVSPLVATSLESATAMRPRALDAANVLKTTIELVAFLRADAVLDSTAL